MPARLEFGVYQRIVYLDLEPASGRGDERHVLNLRFERLEQTIRQAYSPVCIMSDSAVGNRDL